jgi:hypothetical protein
MKHSNGTTEDQILAALSDGEKTREQLLAVCTKSMQGVQSTLQVLVIRERIVRVRPGVYAIAGKAVV